ncbi:alpha/beta-hydrolase [Acaromyces ingoldii]|uniref:Alpha/beta-hydrolase n=1 Tax=Acaromyces ingoldii TaxID=215250 RepID=A0A316YKM2_9BASI|nr:alpha/beta-hydrolase [Acaromyces ingoldii]PWN89742.1 alpha/beta-hydrolase [Acaromyces ingoldii]
MLRQVLIDELGIIEADLTPDQNLADLGLDSLMSLQVLGVMQEKVNMELPSSLFMDYPTFRKVDEFLQRLGAPSVDSQVSQPSQPSPPSQPSRPTASADAQARQVTASLSKSTKDDQASVQEIMKEVGTTKPVLVSGRSFVGKQAPLYLLPDGSGTGAVYMETASLGRPVYAVTSPHLAKNKHANWSVEEIAAKYLECIATIHPGNQELFLGGWSFGGIVAFEACRLLESRGSIPVLGVLLIDCPDPTWPPLPDTVLDWVYGPNGNPELKKQAPPGFSPTMRSHFDSTLAALARYKPAPLKAGPPFIVVNGLDGLGGSPDDVVGYNTAVGWLQKDRQNLGLHGWDRYLPEHSATVVEVEGNHFTVCKRNATEALATALQSLWSQS